MREMQAKKKQETSATELVLAKQMKGVHGLTTAGYFKPH